MVYRLVTGTGSISAVPRLFVEICEFDFPSPEGLFQAEKAEFNETWRNHGKIEPDDFDNLSWDSYPIARKIVIFEKHPGLDWKTQVRIVSVLLKLSSNYFSELYKQ